MVDMDASCVVALDCHVSRTPRACPVPPHGSRGERTAGRAGPGAARATPRQPSPRTDRRRAPRNPARHGTRTPRAAPTPSRQPVAAATNFRDPMYARR
jgi:hypothetical protein